MSGALDLHFLETFQVGNLLGALNLLVSWLETGFCNFHTLPLGVKKDMPTEMVQCMEEKAAECKLCNYLCITIYTSYYNKPLRALHQ